MLHEDLNTSLAWQIRGMLPQLRELDLLAERADRPSLSRADVLARLRGRRENLFKCLRQNFDLDSLTEYRLACWPTLPSWSWRGQPGLGPSGRHPEGAPPVPVAQRPRRGR